MLVSVRSAIPTRRNLHGSIGADPSKLPELNVNTATRLHAGDRPRDLTTIGTALRRHNGLPNLRLEAAAWRQLSTVLAADPVAALSCALDIARVLCHAGTAGLSLLKPDRAHTTVRWERVRGGLAPYEGRDTPLGCSPCGLCLDAGATILVSRPERAFAWLEEARPSIHEELIAPLQASSGRVEGTVWIAHHDGSHCSADDVRIMEQLAHHIVLALRLQEHATDREHALSVLQSFQAAQQALLSSDLSHERSQRLHAEAAEHEARRDLMFKEAMIEEVNHRTKNTLLAASGLLSLQARGASSEEVTRALLDSRDRLQLLADVHAMLCTAGDKSQTVLMPQLLQTLCDALRRSFGSSCHGVSLELTSDPISLPVDDAIAIALLSNETITNAYKHAFADAVAGEITVQLHRTPEHALVLRIANSGVGADLAQAEEGMGLKLIRSLAAQLHGTLELEGRAGATGTQVTLTMVNSRSRRDAQSFACVQTIASPFNETGTPMALSIGKRVKTSA
jgi:two-component sensor histidine kinase